MKTPSRRTFRNAAILLVLGLVALGASSSIAPLRLLERHLLGYLARAINPAPMILGGAGSPEDPWTRRLSVPPPAVPAPPRILRIEEDKQGYFSEPNLQPVDFGVILARLSESGHQVIGVGNLLAWKDPDPLALTVLRKQLDRYTAAVIALPLARGAAPEPVAAPFVRWSVPVDRAAGKVNMLPQVNRISTADVELGGEKTLAGFSILENETDLGEGPQPLLAQWGERLVFAFPLALEIAAQGLQPEDVIIHVGKEIRLGSAGPVIPIDEFGRGAVPVPVTPMEAPAMRLISETNPLPPGPDPLVMRDVRDVLSDRENTWSARLPATLQALRLAPAYQPAAVLPRPDPLMELGFVLGMATLAAWCTAQRRVGWRLFGALLLCGLAVQVMYLFALRQNLWLPPLAMLLPPVIALGLSFGRDEVAAEAAPVVPAAETPVAPAVAPEPAADPKAVEEESVAAAPRAARKTAKKAAAKKAAKKAPAKKAAKKAPRRKSDPPDESGEAAG